MSRGCALSAPPPQEDVDSRAMPPPPPRAPAAAAPPVRGAGSAGRNTKHIADPIHKMVELSPLCVALMDTPAFQRLRDLKQLGLTHYVYPSALHNRFSHSIGVCHLAGTWTDALLLKTAREGGAPYQFDSADATLAAAAGLCHDLGHGPFSHVFEHLLLPAVRPEMQHRWCHEAMSARLLDHILEEAAIDLTDYGLSDHRQAVRTIQALMTGDRPGGGCLASPWLFDVVANKRNGVDVDKMDYLARDAHFTGVPLRVDTERIMSLAKATSEGIVYHHKAYHPLHQLFYDRAMMHRGVYTHAKVKSIELMLTDALKEAECELQMASKVDDVESFLHLTDDSVLHALKHLDPDRCEHPASMRRAQALWQRVERRELYRFCDEVVVPYRHPRLPTPAELASLQAPDGLVDLSPDDIIVITTSIDFSLADRDPRSQLEFIDEPGGSPFHMRLETVSSLLNENVQERRLRVFTRRTDRRAANAVKAAFRRWGQLNLHTRSGASAFSTPHKAPRSHGGGGGDAAVHAAAAQLQQLLAADGGGPVRAVREDVRHPLRF